MASRRSISLEDESTKAANSCLLLPSFRVYWQFRRFLTQPEQGFRLLHYMFSVIISPLQIARNYRYFTFFFIVWQLSHATEADICRDSDGPSINRERSNSRKLLWTEEIVLFCNGRVLGVTLF
jgi:hypothetical protein